ncbi:hypothetical protein Sden_3655 [Shewanella denitrificans OS217]|jgi:flagellar biosynthesis chaperone FliJ|uniref:Flagellar FliJ protein n=1 Tax=Shewanella denitrificans (strain OS217 / ATCC BAA-1090 / DSM 15013) TaxID=318161 RepID=Q12HZ6_SHEDO|nr:flagellar FliJ family protein [Shewanella denitrificans]ABE56930.1 hypothetical protein Sden_3655 [Shewanella denitrificans OS217]
MSHKRLTNLCDIEQKKLLRLGEQKQTAHQRLNTNQAQCQQLTQMIAQYRSCDAHGQHPLLWQNANNMAQVLVPMTAKLQQTQSLLQQEQLRLDHLWRRQLGRQQGMKWLQGQRQAQALTVAAQREQKSADDLASFYTGSR